MKIIIIAVAFILFATTSFSQTTKENGTIYIKHPYIDVVNSSIKAYLAKDDVMNRKIYADTAKFWSSGMEKPIGLNEMVKMWDGDFDKFDSIKLTVVGYPDYLHYVDQDSKIVQSWWTWMGKSKKSGDWKRVDFVEFDNFNKDGKIDFETAYGDFSKMME